MGKTISGVIVNQKVNNIQELETLLNCKLLLVGKGKSKDLCTVYVLPNSTFLETGNDISGEPVGVTEGTSVSFILSGASDAFSLNICNGSDVVKGFKSLGGERFEEFGDFPSNEESDDYSLILKTINESLGDNIHDIIDSHPSQRYQLKFTGIKVQYPESVNGAKLKQTELRPNFKEVDIQAPMDTNDSTEIFNKLLSADTNEVLNTLSEIVDSKVNTHTMAYILVLTRFHVDTKVRAEAKKLLKKFASGSLWDQVESSWDDKHRNIQGYHEKQEYYQHKHIDPAEYFLFAYVNRRNFFSIRPLKGMYNTYSSMTANKDEIQNVFECYGNIVQDIPEKIIHIDHIRVAKFNWTVNLNLPKSIELLSYLPNLHNLVLFATKFESFPNNISKLSSLKNLELYENKFTSFPVGMHLPNLSYLGIQYNNISELDFNSFPNLSTLKVDINYKAGSIIFKNLKKPLSILSGKQVIEEVMPNL